MRRSIIITVLVVSFLGVRFVALPRFALHLAKARAIKKYADAKWDETLKTVPKSPPERLAAAVEYTNTVWLEPTNTGCALGFPSDTFTRDRNPKRQNTVVHHARYRVLALRGAVSVKMLAPVMQPLGFTNLYDFFLSVYRATEQDISRQPNMDALQRHLVLLEARLALVPVSDDGSCAEFTRDDVRGFIIGDPARSRSVDVLVYLEGQQEFIYLAVIRDAPIQWLDLEELIRVLKVRPNHPAAGKAGIALLFAFVYHSPGLPEPGRSARGMI